MTEADRTALHQTRAAELHEEARTLVDFDMGSIRQMVAARHDDAPTFWIVEPEGYEQDGHTLRDNEAVRLIAYVADSGMIYATDGCNSCWHTPDITIHQVSAAELLSYSDRTRLPVAMLELLQRLIGGNPSS